MESRNGQFTFETVAITQAVVQKDQLANMAVALEALDAFGQLFSGFDEVIGPGKVEAQATQSQRLPPLLTVRFPPLDATAKTVERSIILTPFETVASLVVDERHFEMAR